VSGISGIVPILLTPFRQDGKIDFESLRREVDMSLDAGVHGIGIAIGSEIFKLTHAERLQMLGAVADQVAGAVPLVMNTSAPGTQVAVQLAARCPSPANHTTSWRCGRPCRKATKPKQNRSLRGEFCPLAASGFKGEIFSTMSIRRSCLGRKHSRRQMYACQQRYPTPSRAQRSTVS